MYVYPLSYTSRVLLCFNYTPHMYLYPLSYTSHVLLCFKVYISRIFISTVIHVTRTSMFQSIYLTYIYIHCHTRHTYFYVSKYISHVYLYPLSYTSHVLLYFNHIPHLYLYPLSYTSSVLLCFNPIPHMYVYPLSYTSRVLLCFSHTCICIHCHTRHAYLCVPVIYLTSTMALGTMSVCLTVFVLNLHHQDGARPVPTWSRVLVLHYLSKVLCVTSRKPDTEIRRRNVGVGTLRNGLRNIVTDIGLISPGSTGRARAHAHAHNGIIVENGDSSATEMQELVTRARRDRHVTAVDHMTDWREMAHVLDRLFFYVVFILMTAATLVVFCVPAANNSKTFGEEVT